MTDRPYPVPDYLQRASLRRLGAEHRMARRNLKARAWASFGPASVKGGTAGVWAVCNYCGTPCCGADGQAVRGELEAGVVHMVCDGQALVDAAEEIADAGRRLRRDRRTGWQAMMDQARA